ncbi:MAG: DNA-3-methyladenine glycosylase 2 family protein [Candidatus Eremiobacteraeota bacterium]|nr:DNA-3-methyladenine glycosylase 2 family protein [Candidatus Eremiobacteraeota bacterium]MCW5866407.1 DNA-3-methyladenine glycosylase 2 family protein [Candidatus Eremiobacteraeota bacterium]
MEKILLPPGYRAQEVWNFHARDTQQLCESVTPGRLFKRLVWRDKPVEVRIQLQPGTAEASGPPEVARRLLGLTLDPTAFEQAFAKDPYLGPLIQKRSGLRLAQMATPFEAITWAVMGQQVNLTFALQLRRTFIELADVRHDGRFYYPDAAAAAVIREQDLTGRKFSGAKARTLVRLAQLVKSGELNLDQFDSQQLLQVKGIGPWTVQYALLRGYGYGDCSLHGDAVVKKALQQLFDVRLDAKGVEQLLARYQPHRSLAALHCWAFQSKQA